MSEEKPVYLERWVPHHQGNLRVADEKGYSGARPEVQMPPSALSDGMVRFIERQKLAASAPALVRALLLAEWAEGTEEGDMCGGCNGAPSVWTDGIGATTPSRVHARICDVDAALTAAGFPDKASRDDARKQIEEAKRGEGR